MPCDANCMDCFDIWCHRVWVRVYGTSVTWEKVVEMESGGNAAGCGHEVVTVLSRILEGERGGGGGEGFVTLRFNKSFRYKRLSFNYC